MTSESSVLSKESIRRFAAEFVVIVMGVLVALAVDAALKSREERSQEQAYYDALALELAGHVEEYAFSIRMVDRSLAAARAVRAAIRQEPSDYPRPLAESVEYASWVNYPSWTSGTIEELFSAGTIRIISDAAIKKAINDYRSEVAEWRPRIQGPEFSAHFEYRRVADRIVPLELRLAYWARSLDDPPLDTPVDDAPIAARIAGDEALLAAVENMILEWTMIRGIFRWMQERALDLVALIEERER